MTKRSHDNADRSFAWAMKWKWFRRYPAIIRIFICNFRDGTMGSVSARPEFGFISLKG
jgi:hypothetical protein